MNSIKNAFYLGLKITLPILITVGILIWLLNTIELFFGGIIKLVLPPEYYIKGMGALFGLLLILIVGIIMNAMFISRIYDYFEGLIKKIPGVKIIYGAIQDIMGFLDQSGSSDHGATVLVEVIGPIKILGFITRQDLSNLKIAGDDEVCVYCPLSYQIGGMTIFVPRSKLKPVEINAQEAMSFIFTAGISKKKTGRIDAKNE